MDVKSDEISIDARVETKPISYKRLPDEIVISGLSGRLPESSTIQEFKVNLWQHHDMVSDEPRRWPAESNGSPTRFGKIKVNDLESLDHEFFGIDHKQAEGMNPQMRMLLESTYEAIIDAGVNPHKLRGSCTGAYIGVSHPDVDGSDFANRLACAFDLKGSIYAIDRSSSSSLYAMAQAFDDLKAGRCDAAIVAGSNLILKPEVILKHLGLLSDDGKCKSFDETASGCVQSDGCVVVFMQKSSQARRIYSTVLNVRTNANNGQTTAFPTKGMQCDLMRATYDEIELNPIDVSYVEAHGIGTKVEDTNEVNAITDVFCSEVREAPLLIGSVASNMGNSEAASGLCAIVKVLLAMESDEIPGNLHFTAANPELYGVIDGRVKVVDSNTPWSGGVIGVNSFGFDGANAHIILKSNAKQKCPRPSGDTLPRLAVVSGRTSEAVDLLLNEAIANHTDDEYLSLMNELYSKNTEAHDYRGYVVAGESTRTIRETCKLSGDRPIWYIYSGMGSQWASMAKNLMQLDVFRSSIERCADVLKPEGMDLIELLTESDEATFENVLNSFVAICAVQIGLTDVLTHFDIQPDGIVGHSTGEFTCGYADGGLTAEQTILIAYWQGRCILNANMDEGMMAAIGLSWNETKARLPSDVCAACHNCADSVSIAGPPESVEKMVTMFKSEKIFAKAIKSSGCAFHSKYMAGVAPVLRDELEKIIPMPKNRTSRWLSTSLPESEWSGAIAQQCSPDYYINNLQSPVLFHEAIQKIPKNAICVEIAPTGLLPAILKRALGPDAPLLSLLKRGHQNNVAFCLSNIGKLYAAGKQPSVMKLYHHVAYPVGRGTPMLNSHVGWNHSERFVVSKSE